MRHLLVLLVLPVMIGAAFGFVLGGRIGNIADANLRALWLLGVAAVLQAGQVTLRLPGWALLAVFGLVVSWLAANLVGRRPAVRAGLWAVLVGALANATAIALNGRMPFSPAAATAAGLDPGLHTPKNVAADAATVLGWPGDVLPVPPLAVVVSVGDIGIAVGIALVTPGPHGRREGPRQQPRGVTPQSRRHASGRGGTVYAIITSRAVRGAFALAALATLLYSIGAPVYAT